jgi:hypothetical protein
MTDKEAMKLALEALETLMLERGSIYEQAITALKERLAQDKALQALHNENERLGLYKDAYAEQEPLIGCVNHDCDKCKEQQVERNFCSRCGKRTPDLITIHTCTPPKD